MAEPVALEATSAPTGAATVGVRPRRWDRAGELVTVSGLGITSVLNYAYTIALIWLLPARDYAVFGAASALLLVCGTISAASVPWVLAREVACGQADAARRSAAAGFCLLATTVESLVASSVVIAIAATYGGTAVVGAAVASVTTIFFAAAVVGHLQGHERFGAIAALRVAEVAVKITLGAGLVLAGAGAAGALAGYAAGAVVVVVVGGRSVLPDLRWSGVALGDTRLWRTAAGLVSVQGGVAVVASCDIVVGSLLLRDRTTLATYLAAQVFARIPVYVATGLSMVVFPRLVAGRGSGTRAISDTLRLQLVVSVPLALVVATVPTPLVHVVFPAAYRGVPSILAATAAGGVMMGMINLVTTFFQAAGRYRVPSALLFAGIGLQLAAVVIGIEFGGLLGLALGAGGGATVVASALTILLRISWPTSLAGVARPTFVAAVVALPLVALRADPLAWVGWAVVGVGVPVTVALVRSRHAGSASGGGRPRVLHFAIEDPDRPGAGGGSVRTREVNSRLATDFDITVVCARYPGARTRYVDGVRYVHLGWSGGHLLSSLSYFLAIPYALARYGSDLVVEDFNAPFSSVALPWLTRRPTVGVVQWLFAREKAAQYHLPFHLMEAMGVRAHSRLVAVSPDLGRALQSRNPSSEVTVVSNGLDEEAFCLRRAPRSGIVYMGRLEIAQKGLDMLLGAWASVAAQVGEDLYLAGDGPDMEALRSMASELGVADRVHFLGRIAYRDRMDLLARSSLVVMPSRYETFGMVAAEAMAQETPVLAFDIPCLGSLLEGGAGVTVAAFDVTAFAAQLAALASDPARRLEIGRRGRAAVAPLRWDRLAPLQAEVYRRALTDAPVRPAPSLIGA